MMGPHTIIIYNPYIPIESLHLSSSIIIYLSIHPYGPWVALPGRVTKDNFPPFQGVSASDLVEQAADARDCRSVDVSGGFLTSLKRWRKDERESLEMMDLEEIHVFCF